MLRLIYGSRSRTWEMHITGKGLGSICFYDGKHNIERSDSSSDFESALLHCLQRINRIHIIIDLSAGTGSSPTSLLHYTDEIDENLLHTLERPVKCLWYWNRDDASINIQYNLRTPSPRNEPLAARFLQAKPGKCTYADGGITEKILRTGLFPFEGLRGFEGAVSKKRGFATGRCIGIVLRLMYRKSWAQGGLVMHLLTASWTVRVHWKRICVNLGTHMKSLG